MGPSWVLGPPATPVLGPIGAQETPDLREDPKLSGGLPPMLGPSWVLGPIGMQGTLNMRGDPKLSGGLSPILGPLWVLGPPPPH